jgi:hypothetical protein
MDTESKRERADSRLEALFAEALEGLAVSKQPITIDKGDGEVITVPPDLRARAAFIRCGQGIVDSQAKLHGLHESQPPPLGNVVFAQVIVLPKLTAAELAAEADSGSVIDVSPAAAVNALPEPGGSLTDGRTPDRGTHENHGA